MTTLEKIRAEITEKINHYEHFSSSNTAHGLEMALDILDKYETKLEPTEDCDNDCEHCAYLECPKEPCEDAVHLTKEAYSQLCLEASKWNELQLCGNAVDRQAVLDELTFIGGDIEPDDLTILFRDRIKQLPSVQPTKFNTRCPECGTWFGYNLEGGAE